jgi:hypothetical protein
LCALKVENVTRATRLVLADALEEINRQIRETEALIRLKERWETRRVVRKDERHGLDGAEATCGVETVITTVPVGAEVEQANAPIALAPERREAPMSFFLCGLNHERLLKRWLGRHRWGCTAGTAYDAPRPPACPARRRVRTNRCIYIVKTCTAYH